MNKNHSEIKDIEIDGNVVRFKKHKGAIKVKVRVPIIKELKEKQCG